MWIGKADAQAVLDALARRATFFSMVDNILRQKEEEERTKQLLAKTSYDGSNSGRQFNLLIFGVSRRLESRD